MRETKVFHRRIDQDRFLAHSPFDPVAFAEVLAQVARASDRDLYALTAQVAQALLDAADDLMPMDGPKLGATTTKTLIGAICGRIGADAPAADLTAFEWTDRGLPRNTSQTPVEGPCSLCEGRFWLLREDGTAARCKCDPDPANYPPPPPACAYCEAGWLILSADKDDDRDEIAVKPCPTCRPEDPTMKGYLNAIENEIKAEQAARLPYRD